ncbi:MAG: SHOCT domain-containing protein [Solirubrobacterales bacterium]
MADTATGTARTRRRISIALIVLASVIGFFSVFALWAKRQALETDTWTETSGELIENEEIEDALSDFLVAELFDNVDVQAQIEKRLPPEAKGLAGPAAGGLRQVAGEASRRALAQPKVQALWEDANRAAHSQLLAVIDDKSEAVSKDNGTVTLHLEPIVAQIAAQVGISGDIADKLPPEAAELEILHSDELESVQTGVDLLRTLAFVLTALTLALYAVAIYIAPGWRREALRSVGFAFVAVGALVLFAHGIAGNAVTSSLSDTDVSEPAVEAAWNIGTSLLTETGQAIIGYGIVIVLAAWLAGPTRAATWIRHAVTPYLRQPAYAYGGLAVLLVLIFWWSPTEATRRLGLSLLLIVLLALGVEMLRRQVIREFPDRIATGTPAGTAQRLADTVRQARERRTPSAPPPASPDEERIAQLERLGKLRESGVLSEEELAAEKRRILA